MTRKITLMKALVFMVFLLLGIGQNLPFQQFYVLGIGMADVAFAFLLFLLLVNDKSRVSLKGETLSFLTPIKAIALMSGLALISMGFNEFQFGAQPKDLFEIVKYLYHLAIMVVTSYCIKRVGVAPVTGFVVGVLITGILALLNPMNPDVLGTPQIFNPNVIGNVLSVAIVFCSFIIMAGYPVIAGVLALGAATIGFFTFSKGTWLMLLSGLLACYLALKSLDHRSAGAALKYGKYLAYAIFASFLYMVYANWETVSIIFQAKIAATEFNASAAEGGSLSARAGLILAALHMFVMNPLLGVGISNYEHVNRLLQEELGSAYYDDDNPNSAWFYVLGCMGFPAAALFTIVFYWFMRRIYHIPLISRKNRIIYTLCIGTIFLIGGNVQLEMLTAYYYWVAIGIAVALHALIARDRARHEEGRAHA